jgi:hypothetical protein
MPGQGYDKSIEVQVQEILDIWARDTSCSLWSIAKENNCRHLYRRIKQRLEGRPSIAGVGGQNKTLTDDQKLPVNKYSELCISFWIPASHRMIRQAAQ